MRIVAGTARGRRLVAPTGRATRPTSDRVREALFNSLGSQGLLAGARVVDLFAGTGALGIEALSRGATHAWFVEHDRRAVEAIRANLAATGTMSQASIVEEAVDRALADGALDGVDADLVLVDPPYSFTGWDDLVGTVLARWPATVLVAESDRQVPESPDAGAGRLVDSRRYGTTVVSFVRIVDGGGAAGPAASG